MKINGRTFTIGADPEIFIGENGKFVSAHSFIPGDKNNPHRVPYGAVQVDGMAAEFNIDPSLSLEEFEDNLSRVQESLKGFIGDREFLKATSVVFDHDFLKDIPSQNKELGCSPDYNGWTMQENPPPNSADNMRTAGGHIHIGGIESIFEYDWEHFVDMARLSRILDETVGVYSLIWDKDDRRRQMYGKAGAFRPKKYGMEYRSLSNMWIFNPKLVRFIYDGVVEALHKMLDANYEPNPDVQTIINQSDRNARFFVGNGKAEFLYEVLD